MSAHTWVIFVVGCLVGCCLALAVITLLDNYRERRAVRRLAQDPDV